MNKKEKEIIINTYKDIIYSAEILNFDYTDTKRKFKHLLDQLNLKNERYQVENEIISLKNEYNYIIRETFGLIYNTFKKYNQYVNYDLDMICIIFDDLQFKMTEEEIKCHKARIKVINEYIK